ncbi:MAG: NAD-dependent dehydratase, partial [Thermodesulfobacteriota bacterium]
DERLIPSFYYDEVFGTVLNRFIVQAVCNHPLTVYGTGTQIRGYLNLKDTMQCIDLSAANPADKGELRVFNQLTETFSVNELAEKVEGAGNRRGHKVKVEKIENPRVEKEEHYYNPKYTGLVELGLSPHFLTGDVLDGIFETVERHKDRIERDAIFRGVSWK